MTDTTDFTGILEYFWPIVPHDPGEVVLIGYNIPLGEGANRAVLTFELNVVELISLTLSAQKKVNTEKFNLDVLKNVTAPEIALIRAYIFEGNVYKVPKPKLMVLDEQGKKLADVNKGAPEEGSKELRYWRINKLERAIEITVDTGLIEQLVLESNLPGKRSPNSYAANFQMASRSVR